MERHDPTPSTSTTTQNETESTERLWNSKDLARYIGCSQRELRNLRYAGLPTIQFRHLIRFEPEAVKTWLRDNCTR